MELTFKIQADQKILPHWTSNATHYFENEKGEQWIAAVVEGTLIFSGSKIDWNEIKFTKEATEHASDYLLFGKEVENNPIRVYPLNKGEKLWVWAVIHETLSKLV